MLLPVVAYDTVQETGSWLIVSFVFHIMLVTAPVSCCNSPAGRTLVFPLSVAPLSTKVLLDGKVDILAILSLQ